MSFFSRTIKRDNNPNRKYANIINEFGKIDNSSKDLYNSFSKYVIDNLFIKNNENIIILSPAESGILIGKWVYSNLDYNKKYFIPTILKNKIMDNIFLKNFKENHCLSHINTHYFIFDENNENFKNISLNKLIIIEDEITTGNTIINLIKIMKNYVSNILIFTLLDNRKIENISNDDNFKNLNIKIFSYIKENKNYEESCICKINYNKNLYRNEKSIIFSIGEAVEYVYDKFIDNCNVLRFIPGTKYEIDNFNIYNRIDLGLNKNNTNYFLYNTFNISDNTDVYIYYYVTDYNITKNLINFLIEQNPLINIIKKEFLNKTIIKNNINEDWIIKDLIIKDINEIKYFNCITILYDKNINNIYSIYNTEFYNFPKDKLNELIEEIFNISNKNDILLLTNNIIYLDLIYNIKKNIEKYYTNSITCILDLNNSYEYINYVFPNIQKILVLDNSYNEHLYSYIINKKFININDYIK
jgi:hypothetical protein